MRHFQIFRLFFLISIKAVAVFGLVSCMAWPGLTGLAAVKPTSSAGLNPALLLLGGGVVGGSAVPVCNPCYLFVSAATNMTGPTVAGIDSFCATQKDTNFPGLPGAGTDYRAVIMASTRNLTQGWVLHPLTDYYSASNSNAWIGTTDSLGQLPAALPVAIEITDHTVWTGIDTSGASWAPALSTCNSWTGTGSGQQGHSSNATGAFFSAGAAAGCSASNPFYCVQQ